MVTHPGVDRWPPAAQVGLVDHVVVDQRGVVEHLQGGSGMEHLVVYLAKHFRAQYHQNRTDLLPFHFKIAAHHIVHHAVVGMERPDDDPVHLLEFGTKPAEYEVEILRHS